VCAVSGADRHQSNPDHATSTSASSRCTTQSCDTESGVEVRNGSDEVRILSFPFLVRDLRNADVCGVCGGFASRRGAPWHSLRDPLPSVLRSVLGFEVGGPGPPLRDLK
jgi:hypothetical protein